MAPIRFDWTLFKRAERWVFALIGVTVVASLAGVFLTTKESLSHELANLPLFAIGVLVVATVIESILRFWRYHTACAALGLPVPFWRLMYYYTVGYALLPTPGKVGTAIRIWLLKVNHDLPYTRTAPLLAMDFISDAIAMCALAALALAVLDVPSLQLLGWLVGFGLFMAVLMTLVAPQLLRNALGTLYLITRRSKPRLFARLRMMVRYTSRVLGWRVLFLTTSQSFVGWALVGGAVGYLLTEMGVPLNMAQGSAVISIGTMGGFLSMMPAGVGGAEAVMGFLLTQFGAPLAKAVLAVAIIRLFVLWFSVLMGLMLLPFALRSGRGKSA